MTTMACVIDTECTFISKYPSYVYHFGAVFGDLEQSNSFSTVKMDYYVKEVMEDIDMFLHTNKKNINYSINSSMKKAHKDAYNNFYKVRKWADIIEELDETLKAMSIEYLTSYNFNFDIGMYPKIGTIRKTQNQLADKAFYLPRNVQTLCLMDIASVLFMNRDYLRFIEKLDIETVEQFRTDKGNPRYSAECCMRYLSNNPFYIEQHTAKRDALLEFQLFMHFWSKPAWRRIIKAEFADNVKGVSLKAIREGWSVKQRRNRRMGLDSEILTGTSQIELPLTGEK